MLHNIVEPDKAYDRCDQLTIFVPTLFVYVTILAKSSNRPPAFY